MAILRSIVAVIAGVVLGSLVNMALIMASGHVIPPPAGADMTTAEGLGAAMHLMEPRHFLFPFLAHALGTLVGAFVAAKVSRSHKRLCAGIVGVLFLIGGIMAARMIPAPAWFVALDLIGAYLPFAWLGHWLARSRSLQPTSVA